MKQSILSTHSLPESYAEFQELKPPRYTHCQICREGFNPGNVGSSLSWRETQISGICEVCWDKLFKVEGDEA
jgi:hypothetical protein